MKQASHFRAVHRRHPQGFTLLEMLLVMFIVSLLVTTVFGIVNTVTQLTNDMKTEQQREARNHGFVELCSRTFRSLPPSTIVRLRNKQTGGRLTSQITLVGAVSPLSGDAGGVTVIETEEAPDGYLRVILRTMSLTQAAAWDKGDTQVGIKVVLLENVASVEWKFLHAPTGEWAPVWNEKVDLAMLLPSGPEALGAPAPVLPGAPRPGMVEMNLAFGIDPAQRQIFWVPPAEPVNLRGGSPLSPEQPAPSPEAPAPTPPPPGN